MMILITLTGTWTSTFPICEKSRLEFISQAKGNKNEKIKSRRSTLSATDLTCEVDLNTQSKADKTKSKQK